MNYYRRYSGDYLRDTARLNLTEHGAYTLLLDYYYSEERPLPSDMAEIYMMTRAMRPEDRKAIDKVLGLFFQQDDDGWHQKRVDHEIEVSKKARDNGKRGGRPITENETGIQTGIQTESVTEEVGESGHPPTTILQPPNPNPQKKSARGTRLPEDWALPGEWQLWALKEEPTWNPTYCRKIADEFHRYWISVAGQRGVKLNWYATWQNRVKTLGPMDPRRAPKRSLGDALKDDDARN